MRKPLEKIAQEEGMEPMIQLSDSGKIVQVPEEEFKSVLAIASLVFEAYKRLGQSFEAAVEDVKGNIKWLRQRSYRRITDEEHAKYHKIVDEAGEKLAKEILSAVSPQLEREPLKGYTLELSLKYSEDDMLEHTKAVITTPKRNKYGLSKLSWEYVPRQEISIPLNIAGFMTVESEVWIDYEDITEVFEEQTSLSRECVNQE